MLEISILSAKSSSSTFNLLFSLFFVSISPPIFFISLWFFTKSLELFLFGTIPTLFVFKRWIGVDVFFMVIFYAGWKVFIIDYLWTGWEKKLQFVEVSFFSMTFLWGETNLSFFRVLTKWTTGYGVLMACFWSWGGYVKFKVKICRIDA